MQRLLGDSKLRLETTTRRDMILTGTAVAALALVLRALPGMAQTPAPQAASERPLWLSEFERITGEAKPVEGKVTFELPETVENGNTIPFSVAVDSPMTDTDHVKAIHVLTTGNPQPLVAAFRFSPDSGVANVASRMRLIKTQEVIVIAEVSTGSIHVARRGIKVAIGCCGY